MSHHPGSVVPTVSNESCRSTKLGRHLFFLTALLLCSAACIGCAPKDQPEVKPAQAGYKPYGVEHATLIFAAGGMSRGYEMLWIDSFGMSEARNIHSEQITDEGFRPTHTLSIRRGSTVTIIDSTMGRAFRFHDHVIDSLGDLPDSLMPAAAVQFEHYITSVGYRHVGDTTLVGLTARVWKQSELPNWLYEWRGLVIGKRTVGPNGSIDLTLQSIDTVTPPDRSHFTVPAGIPIKEAPPGL